MYLNFNYLLIINYYSQMDDYKKFQVEESQVPQLRGADFFEEEDYQITKSPYHNQDFAKVTHSD